MKTQDYDSVLHAVCPVCKKAVMHDDIYGDKVSDPTPCRHLKGIFRNGAMRFTFLHPSMLKYNIDQDHYYDIDFFLALEKKHRMIVRRYRSYLGCCQFVEDFFVFKSKEVKH